MYSFFTDTQSYMLSHMYEWENLSVGMSYLPPPPIASVITSTSVPAAALFQNDEDEPQTHQSLQITL